MRKKSQNLLVLLVISLVFCALPGCVSRKGGLQKTVSPESVPQGLVSENLLKAGGLQILWQNELPLEKSEKLKQLFILGNRIYALSGRNYLAALDGDKGIFIFGRKIAPNGFPVIGPELYKNGLLAIIGDRLVELHPEFGTELSVSDLEISVTCPVVRNNTYFYVAGVDKRLHALLADGKVKIFEVAADNDSRIISIVADDDFVVFATDAGNVISMAPDGPRRLWQFDASDSIVGAIVRDANSLFFACKDTNVYRIDIRTGRLQWKYQTAAILEKSPRVTEGVVYQYVRNKGLAAIDKEKGKLIWQLPEGVDLLAEANGKAYVITNVGTLAVMDNRKAKQLYSVNFAQVSKYVTNTVDSKIYIADQAGRIACLKPTD